MCCNEANGSVELDLSLLTCPRFWKDRIQRRCQLLTTPPSPPAPPHAQRISETSLPSVHPALPVTGSCACRTAAVASTPHFIMSFPWDAASRQRLQAPWLGQREKESAGFVLRRLLRKRRFGASEQTGPAKSTENLALTLSVHRQEALGV